MGQKQAKARAAREARWARRQQRLAAKIQHLEQIARERAFVEEGIATVPGARPAYVGVWHKRRCVLCFEAPKDADSPRVLVGDVLLRKVMLSGGVYTIRNGEMVAYVGRTGNVLARLRTHVQQGTAGFTPDRSYWDWTICVRGGDDEIRLEHQLIAELCPRFNRG